MDDAAPGLPPEPIHPGQPLSWSLYLSQMHDYQSGVLQQFQAAQGDITGSVTASADATAAAHQATTLTTALQLQLATLNAAPPVWITGEYRLHAAPLSAPWLLCDGSDVRTADWPNLSALLKPNTGPGAAAGTFKLPSFKPDYAAFDGSGNPLGDPIRRTYVRGG